MINYAFWKMPVEPVIKFPVEIEDERLIKEGNSIQPIIIDTYERLKNICDAYFLHSPNAILTITEIGGAV